MLGAMETKPWGLRAEIAHGRKVIVSGLSQGAVLAYLLAVRHPDAVICAFPVAGLVPGKLLPYDGVGTAPVSALHGTGDDLIGIDAVREAIAALRPVGATTELHEFRGIGYTIVPAIRDDFVAQVRVVVAGNGAGPAHASQ